MARPTVASCLLWSTTKALIAWARPFIFRRKAKLEPPIVGLVLATSPQTNKTQPARTAPWPWLAPILAPSLLAPHRTAPPLKWSSIPNPRPTSTTPRFVKGHLRNSPAPQPPTPAASKSKATNGLLVTDRLERDKTSHTPTPKRATIR